MLTEAYTFCHLRSLWQIRNAKMSFLSLPNEMIIQIANSLDDSDPEKPIEYKKHREMIRAVMALRLTCKLLAKIAFPHLFRTYCLLPSEISWMTLCTIVTSDNHRGHLETLALEKHDEGTQRYRGWMRAISDDMRYSVIDLSLIPKLKVVKAEDKWLITKKPKSKIRIPRGQCGIHVQSFITYQKAIWSVLANLTKTSSYDFEFVSLNCHMGYGGPWRHLFNLDFSRLKYLRLDTYGVNANLYQSNLYPDIRLAKRLQHLPNLEEFHLNQFFYGREEATVNFTANVLHILQKRDWPRLRHLDLRFLTTTVADLWTFRGATRGQTSEFSNAQRSRLSKCYGGGKRAKVFPASLDPNSYLSSGRRDHIRTLRGIAGKLL